MFHKLCLNYYFNICKLLINYFRHLMEREIFPTESLAKIMLIKLLLPFTTEERILAFHKICIIHKFDPKIILFVERTNKEQEIIKTALKLSNILPQNDIIDEAILLFVSIWIHKYSFGNVRLHSKYYLYIHRTMKNKRMTIRLYLSKIKKRKQFSIPLI